MTVSPYVPRKDPESSPIFPKRKGYEKENTSSSFKYLSLRGPTKIVEDSVLWIEEIKSLLKES